jgi:phosphatidylserine/phosphatidylglycerophosphate/cardiolipin synthase-like enzyme
VLYDSAGSFSLRSSHLAKLKAKPSAHVFAFNPVLSALFRFSGKDMSHRTHRKILIADNLAFAGGMNSTEQYAGPRLGINEFRDTHARIRGPAVEHLTEVFFQSLQEAHAHDKQTWRRLFASLRTRSAAAVTRSSLFAKCLEVLSESDTSSGQRVGQFFESARRKQADRLQALRQSEIEEAEIVANKERAAGAIRAARMAREKGTELQEVGSQSPAQVDGTPGSSMPYAAPTPRASLQRMGRFVGSRLRVLAQSGSSAASYDQFDLMARSTSRQWKDAWRRMKEISKTARAVSSDVAQRAKRLTEDDDEDDHQTTNNNATEKPGATSTTASPGASTSDSPVAPLKPHHPSLPSSALSSLTSALTGTPLPTTGGKSSAAASSIAPFVEQATLSQSPEFFPVFLQILPSNTLRGQFSIHHALMDVLDAAQDYVLITNPFLLPPRGIERALLQAGQRGVRVRLILGGKSDTPFMRWSSTHLYHRFLANNIELYEFQPRILHAKTLTVDGIVSSVGSFNLDFLSSHKLLEVSMGMISAPLAQRMEQQFEVDLKDCKQVTLDSLAERNVAQKLLHWLAFHTSRIVYSFLK